MTINDKIKQVLTIRNLSPSHLADDIGVQRSSISHILSGRNRPSLDIIQRIVRRFPEFTYEWFLEDDLQMATGRSTETESTTPIDPIQTAPQTTPATPPLIGSTTPPALDSDQPLVPASLLTETEKTVDRILLFYTDGTFREYRPATRY